MILRKDAASEESRDLLRFITEKSYEQTVLQAILRGTGHLNISSANFLQQSFAS